MGGGGGVARAGRANTRKMTDGEERMGKYEARDDHSGETWKGRLGKTSGQMSKRERERGKLLTRCYKDEQNNVFLSLVCIIIFVYFPSPSVFILCFSCYISMICYCSI